VSEDCGITGQPGTCSTRTPGTTPSAAAVPTAMNACWRTEFEPRGKDRALLRAGRLVPDRQSAGSWPGAGILRAEPSSSRAKCGRDVPQGTRRLPSRPVRAARLSLPMLGESRRAGFAAIRRPHDRVHLARGVVWGSWLAALAPQPGFLAPLSRARSSAPKNEWIIELAIAANEHRPPSLYCEAAGCIAAIRQSLAPLARPEVPLRLTPDTDEIARLERERGIMRRHYREGGAAAVAMHLPGTLLDHYSAPYEVWRRRGNADSAEK